MSASPLPAPAQPEPPDDLALHARVAALEAENAALRARQALLDAAARLAPMAVGVLSAELRVLEANPAFLRLFPDLPPDESSGAVGAALRRVVATGEPIPALGLDEPGPPGRRWTLSLAPLRREGAEPGVVVVGTEETGEARALSLLGDREELLRVALEAADLAVWEWDLTAGYLAWSVRMEELFGFAPGTFDGDVDSVGQRVHPEDRGQFVEAAAAVSAEGVPFRCEVRALRPDGTVRWVSMLGALRTGPDGGPASMTGVALDVTERRSAEEAAREAARRAEEALALLSSALRAAPLGMSFHDRSLRCTHVSEALARMAGKTAEGLVGRTTAEIDPIVDEYLGPPLRRVLATGRPILDLEMFEPGTVPGRPRRSWLTSFYPVVSPSGVLLGVGSIGREVTEERAAQAERTTLLHELAAAVRDKDEALAVLEGVLAAAPVGVAVIDAQSRYVRVNESLARLNGVPAPAHLRRTVREVVPQLAGIVEPLHRSVLETGRPIINLEHAVPTREGPLRHSMSSYFRVHAGDGPPVGVGVVVVDVTAQKREQRGRALLERTTRLLASSLEADRLLAQLAVELVPELADGCLIHLVQDDGTIRQLPLAFGDPAIRAQAEALLARGVGPPGTPFSSLGAEGPVLVPELDPTLLDQLLAPLDPEAAAFFRAFGLRSFLAVPLVARGGPVGALYCMTLGDRRLDAHDLELAGEIARRAAVACDNARLYRNATEATRARDDFLSIASHELRTPMTALALEITALQRFHARGLLTPEKLDEKVNGAARHVRRLAGLVDDLLDISRITAGRLELRPEPVDLAEAAREVIARFAESAVPGDPALELEAPVPVRGLWDRQKVEQVVTNLVSNGLKYGAGHPVRVRVSEDDGQATLVVRDTGIGIAPDDLRRLFHRFERAAAVRDIGGFGLGLWIVRQVVTAHGGEVQVESTPGVGTTFTVRLPVGGG